MRLATDPSSASMRSPCGRRGKGCRGPGVSGTGTIPVMRTAEELGRAFPKVPVRASGGSRVLAELPGTPAVQALIR
jgi:hypothetical protein